ncbi:MAG: hypothetical protein K2P81_09785 [Bacteriovoracaceae bacterium]|nr:hypothetical protein [Bacteriovoracaceae bacterium]
MLYTGYTRHELDQLLILLDEIGITYEVLMDETTDARPKQRGGGAAILRIEIPDEELKTVDEKFYARLDKFRIYPQYVEAPEEFSNLTELPESPEQIVTSKSKGPNTFMRALGLIAAGAAAYMYISRFLK